MRHLLILKPCCLGDVLMATPLAAALATRPTPAGQQPRVDWAVDAHSRPALAGNPHVDQLIDASGCIRGDLRPRALLSLVGRIRRGGYDAIFVPDRSPILSLVARLSGVRLRVGLASGWRGFGYTTAVPTHPADPRHEAEIYLDLARAVGIADPPLELVFRPGQAERDRVASLLEEAGLAFDSRSSDQPGYRQRAQAARVAIHPGGGINPGMRLTEKRWPVERFASIASRLVAERGARVFLLGGPGDRDLADAFLAALDLEARGGVTDLCGRLSLPELAALVAGCELYLGNDSGAAHLAAATGTPVIVVFGPTAPSRYGPLPGRGRAISPSNAQGSGTSLSSARGSHRIEQVSLSQVWRAVDAALAADGDAEARTRPPEPG